MNKTCTRFIVVRLDEIVDNCSNKHTVSTDILGAYKTREVALEFIDSLVSSLTKAVSSMFGYKTINLKITENSVEYSYKLLELSCKDVYMIKEIEIGYDD